MGGARLLEGDGACHTLPVGQREVAHAALCHPGHQVPAVRGAISSGMPGCGVQMSKSVTAYLPSLTHPLPGLHLLRSPPYPRISASVRTACVGSIRIASIG